MTETVTGKTVADKTAADKTGADKAGAGKEGTHEYWPYYCEENIWHLCEDPQAQGDETLVALISNASRQVAVWYQRAAPATEEPVLWDYHVILLCRKEGTWQVWDLDTVLGLPFDARHWMMASFTGTHQIPLSYAPQFRVLPADVYRRELATDRRHMRRPDGAWASPPPPWPTISEGSNLMQWTDMDAEGPGEVLDFEGMWRRLGEPATADSKKG